MRRLSAFSFALAVLAALPSLAFAQGGFLIAGPGGITNQVIASVTVTNTTAGTLIYNYQVPAGLVSQPLHLRIYGLTTVGPQCILCGTTLNLGVNYGTLPSASVALLNGVQMTSGQSNIPTQIDVYIRPTQLATTAPLLTAYYATFSTTNATAPLQTVAQTQAVAAEPSGQPLLQVTWQWGSASTVNSFKLLNASLFVE